MCFTSQIDLPTQGDSMKLNSMQQFGGIALLCGLTLMVNSLLASQSVSHEEMTLRFGGACKICNTIPGCTQAFACQQVQGSTTRWHKRTSTSQGEAECGDTNAVQAK